MQSELVASRQCERQRRGVGPEFFRLVHVLPICRMWSCEPYPEAGPCATRSPFPGFLKECTPSLVFKCQGADALSSLSRQSVIGPWENGKTMSQSRSTSISCRHLLLVRNRNSALDPKRRERQPSHV